MPRSSKSSYSELLKRIAKNIARRRKSLRLTQEDMQDFGFNYRFYQKLESGKYSPNLQTLHRIASAFDIEVKDLL